MPPAGVTENFRQIFVEFVLTSIPYPLASCKEGTVFPTKLTLPNILYYQFVPLWNPPSLVMLWLVAQGISSSCYCFSCTKESEKRLITWTRSINQFCSCRTINLHLEDFAGIFSFKWNECRGDKASCTSSLKVKNLKSTQLKEVIEWDQIYICSL